MTLRGICIVTALYAFVTKVMPWERRRYLFFMQVCSAIILHADAYAYMFRGDTSTLGWWMVRISNFIVFFFILALMRGFNAYLEYYALEEGRLEKSPQGLKISK